MTRHHSALHSVAPQVRYVLDFGIVRKMVFDEERAMQCARRGDSEHEMPVGGDPEETWRFNMEI